PPEDPLKPATPPPVARALSPRSLLMLQRSFGNAAVAELVRRSQAVAPPKPDPSPSHLAGEDRGFSPSPSGGAQGGGPATTPHKPPAAPPPRPAPASGGGRFAPTRPSPAHAAAGPRPAPPLKAAPAMGEGVTAGVTASAETEFGQAVAAQQAILTQLAEQKKGLIRQDASQHTNGIQQSVAAEAARIEQIFTQAIDHTGELTAQARMKISTDRDTRTNAVQASATEQFAALDTAIQQKQARVVEVGEAKAREAEAVGQQQAARATEGCNARAYQSLLLADQKAQRYASYNRARLIGRTAHEMGSDLARKIQQAGAEMSAAARKDAADMAAKFRKEASQVAEKFVDVRESAQTKIQQARDQTVDALHQMADSSTSQ